jgi:hypothetical protein
MAGACVLILADVMFLRLAAMPTNESVGKQARQHLHPTIERKHCIHICTHVNGLIESTFLSGNANESAGSAKKSTPTIHDRMITCLVNALTCFLSIMGFAFESATTHAAFSHSQSHKKTEKSRSPHHGALSSIVSVSAEFPF